MLAAHPSLEARRPSPRLNPRAARFRAEFLNANHPATDADGRTSSAAPPTAHGRQRRCGARGATRRADLQLPFASREVKDARAEATPAAHVSLSARREFPRESEAFPFPNGECLRKRSPSLRAGSAFLLNRGASLLARIERLLAASAFPFPHCGFQTETGRTRERHRKQNGHCSGRPRMPAELF